MLRRTILTLMASVLLISPVFAESLDVGDLVKKLPALNQGIGFSMADGKFNYLSTVEIVKDLFKVKGLSLEGGYAGAAKETAHKAVVVLSYRVAALRDYGVTLPVLDLLELNLGYYAGYGRIQLSGDKGNDNEFDHGLSATFIKLKF